ncbi:hypothetical protein KAH81_09900 [bacterium]|nr:hypothetical protein [bacterium]
MRTRRLTYTLLALVLILTITAPLMSADIIKYSVTCSGCSGTPADNVGLVVKASGTNIVAPCADDDPDAMGVIVGYEGTDYIIATSGVAWVQTTGTVGIGDWLKPAANGVASVAGDTYTGMVIGQVIEVRIGEAKVALNFYNPTGGGTSANTLEEVYQAGDNSVEMTTVYGDIRFYNDELPTPDEILYLDESSGNVGIGTESPGTKVEIYETGTSAEITDLLTLNYNNTDAIGSGAGIIFKGYGEAVSNLPVAAITSVIENDGGASIDGALAFYTHNSSDGAWSYPAERVRIDSDGNVGIGVTGPTEKLDVDGQIRLRGGSPAVGRILQSDATGVGTWVAPSSISDGDWTVSGSNIYSAVSGNVGIGTTTPAAKLEVYAADALIHGHTVGRGAGVIPSNLAVGSTALSANTTGRNNTAIGRRALSANTTGQNNTAIGMMALLTKTTGSGNTAVGMESQGFGTTGDFNTAIGQEALWRNTGSQNTAVGLKALGTGAVTGSDNTASGYRAGYHVSTSLSGSSNTFLGANASYSSGVITNATAIGANVTLAQSNTVILGNSANVGIGTTIPSHKLDVNGTGRFADILYADYLIVMTDNDWIGLSSAGGRIEFDNQATDEVNIISAKVGINTATPDFTLDVAGTAGFDNYINHNGDSDTKLHFLTDQLQAIIGNECLVNLYEGVQDYVKLGDGGNVDINLNDDVFVRGSDGNVGIGVTGPTEKLDVDGQIRLRGGSPAAGKILQSDVTGVGTWVAPSSISDGDWTVSGSNIYSAVSGNVGIGTTTPDVILDVDLDGVGITKASEVVAAFTIDGSCFLNVLSVDDQAGILFGDAGDPDIGKLIYDNNDDAMKFTTNTSEKMRITSAGNVGIGTTSPDYKLDVRDEFGVASFGSSPSEFLFIKAESSNDVSLNFSSLGKLLFKSWSAYSGGLGIGSFMAITGDGNVGIGTTTPAAMLDIRKTYSGSAETMLRMGSTVFNNNARFTYYATGADNTSYLAIAGKGNATNHLIVRGDGNVGIGTALPNAAAILDVSSTTKGFLPPRMTCVQRDAISSPPEGLMIYNTVTNTIDYYDGADWMALQASTAASLPSAPTAYTPVNPEDIGDGDPCFLASWSAVSGATSYRLDVAEDSGFSSMLVSDMMVGGTEKQIEGLAYDFDCLDVVYYRVRAVNSCGTSANSNTATVDVSCDGDLICM